MLRKMFFTLIIVLTLIGHSNEMSKAGFFDDSIDFATDPVAAWWECGVSDYYKYNSCTIEWEHTEYPTCETDQSHRTSSSWKDKPEKIVVEGAAKYEGHGYVRFSATGGSITRNGSSYQPLTSRIIGGKKVGSEPSLVKKGSKNKKPKYVLAKGRGTVRNTVYEIDPPTSLGNYKLTVNSGKALGDGIEASGGAYVEVSTTFSASPVKMVEVTGTFGVTVEWSKGRDVTNTGILTEEWNWTVGEKNVCNSHSPPQEITNVHDHHWTCPTDNNGCGKHLQCGPPHSNEPDGHELQATCENAGCNEPSVRQCTHECEHEPVRCNSCGKDVATKNEHFKTCGSEVPGATAGCGMKYFICQNSHDHDVLMCGNFSYFENFCGDLYRRCTNPGFPSGGCHYNTAHANGVEVCLPNCFGSSCAACDGDPSTTY